MSGNELLNPLDLQGPVDIVDLIYDFNEQVIGTGDVDLNPLTEKQHAWTQTFCKEELTELQEAFEAQDIVKMVDAVPERGRMSIGI